MGGGKGRGEKDGVGGRGEGDRRWMERRVEGKKEGIIYTLVK